MLLQYAPLPLPAYEPLALSPNLPHLCLMRPCPAGLKSGGAALRFIYTDFHKNLDSLLFT